MNFISFRQFAAMVALLVLGAMFSPMAAQAASDESAAQADAFLAISPVSLRSAQIIPSDKHLAIEYVNTQLALYNLTFKQYLSLDAGIQRKILELPGRSTYVSREMRRQLSDFRVSVPYSVLSKVAVGATLDGDIMSHYAIHLPQTVEMNGTVLPATCERVMIGNKYVLVEKTSGKVVDLIAL
jgi:hypothetical protein